MLLSLYRCPATAQQVNKIKSKYHSILSGTEKKYIVSKEREKKKSCHLNTCHFIQSNKTTVLQSFIFSVSTPARTLCSSPLAQRDSKMAAHLSWRWIALIMHGDHLKASVSYEEHAHLELLVQRRSKARHLKTADCPLERKDKPWQCLLSLSLSHTSFLFLSIALALSLSLSLTLSHSLSPPLSHQKR